MGNPFENPFRNPVKTLFINPFLADLNTATGFSLIWTQSLVRTVHNPTARLRGLFLQVISLTYGTAP